MATTSKVTTDHEEIKRWAEEREGKPVSVKGTGNENDTGLLRINFPGGKEDSLEDISWDEFFEKFDESELAFLYQDKTAGGKTSRFFKIVSRETAAKNEEKSAKPAKKLADRKPAAKKTADKKQTEKKPEPKQAAKKVTAEKKQAEKKPAAKKTADKKTTKAAEKKTTEKKPTAKKTAEKNASAEKKPATKKPAAKKAGSKEKV